MDEEELKQKLTQTIIKDIKGKLKNGNSKL